VLGTGTIWRTGIEPVRRSSSDALYDRQGTVFARLRPALRNWLRCVRGQDCLLAETLGQCILLQQRVRPLYRSLAQPAATGTGRSVERTLLLNVEACRKRLSLPAGVFPLQPVR
jgi:hypothetical protein